MRPSCERDHAADAKQSSLLRFDAIDWQAGCARGDDPEGSADIAAAVGYYDQARLIAEFRSIAGVTPQAMLGELRASMSIS